MRSCAQEVLDTWAQQVKPADMVEGDACVDALKSGSVFLKTALFPWLGDILSEGGIYLSLFNPLPTEFFFSSFFKT